MFELVREVIRQELPALVRRELEPLRELLAGRARAGSQDGEGEDYVPAERAAEIAGVTPATIREWVRQKRIPGYSAGRLLRVRVQEIHAFLRKCQSEPKGVDVDEVARKILARAER